MSDSVISFLVLVAVVFGLVYAGTCHDAVCHAKEDAEDAIREAACSHPEIAATSPDGVTLWVLPTHDAEGHLCRSYPVYFSKSGTQTMHSESHGKTSVDVPDYVPAVQP